MAHSSEDKKKILESLEEKPFITHACKKHGIHRSTVYRWMEEDPVYRRDVESALRRGRENVCDVGEMALMKKAGEGDLGAIKFLLSHNSERYAPKAPRPPPEPEPERYPHGGVSPRILTPDGKVLISKQTADLLKEMGPFIGADGEVLMKEKTAELLEREEAVKENSLQSPESNQK